MDLGTLPVKRTADAALQNSINISIIFHYLRERGSAYRAQISKDLKISAPAVSRAVENLKSHGYIIETEMKKTRSGRNAAEFMVNPGIGYVIGIDLIKEQVRLGIFNFKGTMLKEYEGFSLAEDTDVSTALSEEIDKIIEDMEKNDGRAKLPLKAISIGVPATVDTATGDITATLFRSLEGLNFRELLEDRYRVPVYTENITNLSALAEHTCGQGRAYRHLVFVEISSGIGAGIIINNQLVRGSNGSAGELGALLDGRQKLSYRLNKNKGYLEYAASVESIGDRAISLLRNGRQSYIRDLVQGAVETIKPSHVCEAALAGDDTAKDVIRETVELLATGIINMSLVLNPEAVVLGGDICHLPGLEELFVLPIAELLTGSLPISVPEIMVSSLEEDAGVYGAAYLAVESLLIGRYPFKIEQ